jgi:hypothetical protein
MAKSNGRTITPLERFALSTIRQKGLSLNKTVQARIITREGGLLLAVNGGGLGSADSGPDATALRTDATSPGALGRFTFVSRGTHFALRTAKGYYVTAVDGGGIGDTLLKRGIHQPLVTNGTSSSPYSIFTLIPLTGNQIAIRTSDGQHYVTAVDGGGFEGHGRVPIRTITKTAGTNEWFKLDILGLETQTHNGPPG